jgi:hypothetical protein
MQVLVTDRLHEGESGYWVVTLFEVDGAEVGEDARLAGADTAGAEPIAIPVVRGWVPDAASATADPAPAGDVHLTARLGPVEGPLPVSDLPDGQVRSVSTSQLVNFFEVYSYSGILFPEEGEMTGAGTQMAHVDLQKQEDGGFDWQSAIYAVEWIFFAGFAFYIWFTLLRDAYARQQEQETGAPVEYVVVKQAGETHDAEPGRRPVVRPGRGVDGQAVHLRPERPAVLPRDGPPHGHDAHDPHGGDALQVPLRAVRAGRLAQ